MIIRNLEKNDYANYLDLIQKFRPITVSISKNKFEEIYDKIFNNNLIFVAVINNTLVGSITCLLEQKFIHNLATYLHIEDFIVCPKYRGNGIGKALLKYVKDYSKNNDVFKIILDCHKDLLDFYKKNGFKEYDEIKMEFKL
jgi:GNAT superfamily N-acetyltransferase